VSITCCLCVCIFFFFSSRRRHTRCLSDWSSDVCSSDLGPLLARVAEAIDVPGNRAPVCDLPWNGVMQKSNSGDQRIALEHCPACGGEPLPEVERHDGQGERVPQLIIVADDRAHLYELFQQAFAYHETVRVLRDRRITERRR